MTALVATLASCASSGAGSTSELWVSEAPPLEAASSATPTTPAAAPRTAPPAVQSDRRGPSEGQWEYTLGGSGANDNDFEVGGAAISGSAGYFFDERQELGVRQSVNYSDFGGSRWNGSTRVFYDYHFHLNEAVRPLIGANLGFVYGDTVEETLAAAPEAGVKWYVTDTAFLFVLAEYQFFFEDADEADDAFNDGSFVYTLGIGIHL